MRVRVVLDDDKTQSLYQHNELEQIFFVTYDQVLVPADLQ
jgi:hypothetical protein